MESIIVVDNVRVGDEWFVDVDENGDAVDRRLSSDIVRSALRVSELINSERSQS